jgi:hypothetical protein
LESSLRRAGTSQAKKGAEQERKGSYEDQASLHAIKSRFEFFEIAHYGCAVARRCTFV